MELLFTADPAVWDPTLGDRIRTAIDAGQIVIWRSVSGASLTIANVSDGTGVDVVAIRQNPHDRFASDGLPLILGRPEATSCGLWAPTGYRSSRPVIVLAYDDAQQVGGDEAHAAWAAALLEVAAFDGDDPRAWTRHLPDGHPPERCPVNHCPVAGEEDR